MTNKTRILLNGAFLGQTVTGQQRYATEVMNQLTMDSSLHLRIIRPGRWWSKTPARTWIWSQFLGFRRKSGEYLLTLTSRGPLFARNHIVTVHDLFVLEHPEWYLRKYSLTHALALRSQLRSATAVVAVSQPVGEQIRNLTGGRKPVIVATNAPSETFVVERSASDVQKTLAGFDLKPNGYILSVATLDPRKNIDRLIRAHRALPTDLRQKYPLVLVGGEQKSFSSVSFEMHAESKRLGYVRDNDLADLYTGAKAVAFPSLDEGFGLPAVEALARGATLITSDVEVQRWVCGPHAIYVNPKDEESIRRGLVASIEEVQGNDERSIRRQYVLQRYRWSQTKDDLIEQLSSIGSSHRDPD